MIGLEGRKGKSKPNGFPTPTQDRVARHCHSIAVAIRASFRRVWIASSARPSIAMSRKSRCCTVMSWRSPLQRSYPVSGRCKEGPLVCATLGVLPSDVPFTPPPPLESLRASSGLPHTRCSGRERKRKGGAAACRWKARSCVANPGLGGQCLACLPGSHHPLSGAQRLAPSAPDNERGG